MTNTTDKEKRSPDKPLSDHALSVIAEQGLTDLYRRLATELLAHRAAERKRAEETLSMSRERLKVLTDSEHYMCAQSEQKKLARFALAHLPAEDKMTEAAEPLVEHHATVAVSTKQLTDDARQQYKLRETLLTLVKTSSERDTVRRAALALIEGS